MVNDFDDNRNNTLVDYLYWVCVLILLVCYQLPTTLYLSVCFILIVFVCFMEKKLSQKNSASNCDETLWQWTELKLKRPTYTGAYLCITNDDLCVVCIVSANGWWRIAITGEHASDMGYTVIDGKRVEREVTHWMKLPKPPES